MKTEVGLISAARERLARESGFTIVELVVVTMITMIVVAAILAIFLSLSGAFNNQMTRVQNQDDARTAINQMARYIRMATSSADSESTLSNAILTALPQDFEFYCDVDGDGVADKVRYYLDGATLLMQTLKPEKTAEGLWEYAADYQTDGIVVQDSIRNGASAVFTYYKYVDGALEDCVPVTAAEKREIKTVAISVEVNARPDLAKGSVILATDVQIRQRYEGELK